MSFLIDALAPTSPRRKRPMMQTSPGPGPKRVRVILAELSSVRELPSASPSVPIMASTHPPLPRLIPASSPSPSSSDEDLYPAPVPVIDDDYE